VAIISLNGAGSRDADRQWIQYSVVLLLRTSSRIFGQNPRSDADSKFWNPHTSDGGVAVVWLRDELLAGRLIDGETASTTTHVATTLMRAIMHRSVDN